MTLVAAALQTPLPARCHKKSLPLLRRRAAQGIEHLLPLLTIRIDCLVECSTGEHGGGERVVVEGVFVVIPTHHHS